MGKVERAIRQSTHPGMQLATPGQAKPFEVADVDRDGIVLLLGDGQWRTSVPWHTLEGLADLLSRAKLGPNDRLLRTGRRDIAKRLPQAVPYRETSNWVMVVLERAGVVEIDRRRPITARLINGF